MQINIGERWRHVKSGGEYEIVAIGRLQVSGELDMAECVVYKSLRGSGDYPVGSIWVRPLKDFLDGRFVKVD
jgi:hypothetical protein